MTWKQNTGNQDDLRKRWRTVTRSNVCLGLLGYSRGATVGKQFSRRHSHALLFPGVDHVRTALHIPHGSASYLPGGVPGETGPEIVGPGYTALGIDIIGASQTSSVVMDKLCAKLK